MLSSTMPISSEGGDNTFQNNVPNPVTSGKELPTFKFELEKSEGTGHGRQLGKEATVVQLPISKGIAGVSMRLEPGVMRELHWHATAAEWAFVTKAGCAPRSSTRRAAPRPTISIRATSGISRAATATSSRPWATSRAISFSIFDNGYFSEFGTFSITDWIGHAPKELLAKNFGLPAVDLREIPEGGGLFRQGKNPAGSRCPALARAGNRHRSPTNTACCPRSRSRPSTAASSGGPTGRNSRFPRP